MIQLRCAKVVVAPNGSMPAARFVHLHWFCNGPKHDQPAVVVRRPQ
jgi:hypothetical protein